MKVGQNVVVRWVAKLAAKPHGRKGCEASAPLRALDIEQLRQVSGGTGASTQSPNKFW